MLAVGRFHDSSFQAKEEKTQMDAKTYDGHTARFLGAVAMSMPKLDGDIMQGWIQNPRALQKVLSEALSQDQSQRTYVFNQSGSLTEKEKFTKLLHLIAQCAVRWRGEGLQTYLGSKVIGKWSGPGNGSDGKFDVYHATDRAFFVESFFDILPHLEGDIVFNDPDLFGSLIKRQAHGEKGLLATDGSFNIAYCRFQAEEMGDNCYWVVYARWSDDEGDEGWKIDICPAGEPFSTHAGQKTGSRFRVNQKITRVITPGRS